jgi:hypothetical protein
LFIGFSPRASAIFGETAPTAAIAAAALKKSLLEEFIANSLRVYQTTMFQPLR